MESLEKRLTRQEARESIRECVYRYALAGDRKNDPTILQTLFTANAVCELVGFGSFNGRDDIVDGLSKIGTDTVLFSYHLPGGPLISLSDELNLAKAFWWVWAPGRLSDGPVWGALHYNAELLPEAGQWKFQRLRLEARLRVPFDGPWTEQDGPFTWPDWVTQHRPIG